MFKIWTYDTQHNDTQPNDTQHNGTQYCHAECICCVSFTLSVVTSPIMLLLSVIYAECHYVECHYVECRNAQNWSW